MVVSEEKLGFFKVEKDDVISSTVILFSISVTPPYQAIFLIPLQSRIRPLALVPRNLVFQDFLPFVLPKRGKRSGKSKL